MVSRHVLLTTFGSLGDLHPFLAIGQALQQRGHTATIGTQAIFRERVEAAGLRFKPLRLATVEKPSSEIIGRVFDGGAGVRYLLRELLIPSLQTAYEDTAAAAKDVDVLVSHPLTFATPLAAERSRVPWLSTQLAPNGLHSVLDPAIVPGMDFLLRMRRTPWLYRVGYRLLMRLAEWQTGRWLAPVAALRRELGLSRGRNPLLSGAHAPDGVLALFSRVLASPQRDWPAAVTVTGFPFYRQIQEVPAALQTWLDAGSAPVVFTLGSSAVLEPGSFFSESVAAAKRLRRRALLVGYADGGLLPLVREGGTPSASGGLLDGDEVYAVPYTAYAKVFPQAAAVVHQGGIGTTAEVLRAGRPMLVVPFGVDQPDNGVRVARLGVAEVVGRKRYRAARVAAALGALLSSDKVQEQARAIGETVRAEEGATVAAEAIVRVANRAAGVQRSRSESAN